MSGPFNSATLTGFSTGKSPMNLNKVPIEAQMPSFNAAPVAAQPAPVQKKAARKNPSAAERRCDAMQKIVLNQDTFGLVRLECLINLSGPDVAKYSEYVQYHLQRGHNFSLKAQKAQ